ncbi:TniQ family protein [Nonomuraea sp. B12E4]|uniref:TniQ family protein n=1 Tax=Nonomuraea sp. B12E4 TaxID=3153564 RepID=UPI00325E4D8D
MVAAEFARFLGIPLTKSFNQINITNAVCDVLCDLGTSLVLIDEIHNVTLNTRNGAEVSDQLKYLAERIPATFVYSGIDVDTVGLFNGVRGKQLAGRFTTITTSSFAYGAKEQREDWTALVATLEDALRLDHHKPGSLVRLAGYLHERTGGMIGSLSHLIREAAIESILTGTREDHQEGPRPDQTRSRRRDQPQAGPAETQTPDPQRPTRRLRRSRMSPGKNRGQMNFAWPEPPRQLPIPQRPLPGESTLSFIQRLAHVNHLERELVLRDLTQTMPVNEYFFEGGHDVSLNPHALIRLAGRSGTPLESLRHALRTSRADSPGREPVRTATTRDHPHGSWRAIPRNRYHVPACPGCLASRSIARRAFIYLDRHQHLCPGHCYWLDVPPSAEQPISVTTLPEILRAHRRHSRLRLSPSPSSLPPADQPT